MRKLAVFILVMSIAVTSQAAVNVVCTLPSLAAIAREVGGDFVEVRSLAAATEDPHFVDARPNLLLPMNRADLLIANGLELEVGWLPSLQVSARNKNILVGAPGYLEVAPLVDLLDAPAGRIDRAMGDIHPGGNPHFLADAGRVARIAEGVAVRLAQLDDAHAAAYRANAARFAAELRDFGRAQQARFAKLPLAQRQVVTYHRSLVYVEAWLDLTEVATLEPRPGVPPDPAHVASVLALMRGKRVPAIVQEEFYPTSNSRTLAQLAKASLVVLHGGVRFDAGERYIAYLTRLTDDLFAALAHGAG